MYSSSSPSLAGPLWLLLLSWGTLVNIFGYTSSPCFHTLKRSQTLNYIHIESVIFGSTLNAWDTFKFKMIILNSGNAFLPLAYTAALSSPLKARKGRLKNEKQAKTLVSIWKGSAVCTLLVLSLWETLGKKSLYFWLNAFVSGTLDGNLLFYEYRYIQPLFSWIVIIQYGMKR